MIKYQVKLAGGEIKDSGRPQKGKQGDDPYGEKLELMKRVREYKLSDAEMEKYTKPL